LTVDALAEHARRTCPGVREAVYVAYFSLAELQFIDVIEEAREVRLYGRGSTDAGFHARRGVDVSIRDVARFFDGQGLRAAAASFGLEKLDFDVSNVSRADLADPRFRDYTIRDARLARIIFERLREEWLRVGVDLLCYPTAAAAAAALWRRRDLQVPIGRPLPRERALALACSWGGRAEAFRRGAVECATELDLKSAYPRAVLSYGAYPRGDDWRAEFRLAAVLGARWGMAEVDFEFPRETFAPVLPVVVDGVMLFPLRGRSCATADELRLAESLGARLRLVRGMAADGEGDDSAARFMAWATEERQHHRGTARAYVSKLASNALTGKWSQNRDGIDYDAVLRLSRAEGVRPAALFRLGPLEQEELGIAAAPRLGGAFVPEWYALTTGRIRARLGEALNRGTSALYCATDSVWQSGVAAPPSPEWDVKGTGRAVVARTRLAVLDAEKEHLAFHGVSSPAAAREMLARFALAGEDVTLPYESRRPRGLREGMRRDYIVGRWFTESREASTKWDQKRRLIGGGETVPWEMARERQR
jgi:hypothetical protein